MTEIKEIYAPWSAEQVAAFNRFQRTGGMHPFTCGGDHRQHVILVAHTDGWHCPSPDCGYTQNWAPSFMIRARVGSSLWRTQEDASLAVGHVAFTDMMETATEEEIDGPTPTPTRLPRPDVELDLPGDSWDRSADGGVVHPEPEWPAYHGPLFTGIRMDPADVIEIDLGPVSCAGEEGFCGVHGYDRHPNPEAGERDELTAEDAHSEVDRLASELYQAQDNIASVREMCALQDRKQQVESGCGTVSTADVLHWLEGSKCLRIQGIQENPQN